MTDEDDLLDWFRSSGSFGQHNGVRGGVSMKLHVDLVYLYVHSIDGKRLLHIPRLNSTFPSLPPLSQNCSSREFAETACRCGKAAKARGRAKMEVVRIRPACVSVEILRILNRAVYLDSQAASSLVSVSAIPSAVTAPGSKVVAP